MSIEETNTGKEYIQQSIFEEKDETLRKGKKEKKEKKSKKEKKEEKEKEGKEIEGKEKKENEGKETDEKEGKLIDRINKVIEKISVIETKPRLEKFHIKYIQPILEIDNEKLNENMQEHIQLLTSAYDSHMKKIDLDKVALLSPKTPTVSPKTPHVSPKTAPVSPKTLPVSPKTPPPEDFLRVFGKEEYVRVYETPPPKEYADAYETPPPKKSKNAYAIVHFGSNPVYLELELYFFIMLRKYTNNDILYLYSVNDTPSSFVDAARPFVTDVVPYDDRGITYDVNFESGYSNFNTLRTCNFIFAYTLETYEKVCIIESDMVIMGSIDSVFNLNAPAVLTYYIGEKQLKSNNAIKNDPKDVIAKCKEMGRTNGGVMLIEPSIHTFENYKDKIQDVVKHTCKYPNETLFEYVNTSYFNMPIQYNLSHFLAKPNIIKKYGLSKDEILVFHFNETKFKHIDIIKNPVDDTGINWLENPDPKYAIKRNAVMHYKDTVYDKHPEIKAIMLKLSESPKKAESTKKAESPKTPPPEDFLRVFGKDEFIRIHGKEEYDQNYKKSSPANSSPAKSSSYKKKKPKVKKTQKCKEDEEINPETGRCRKVCPPGTIRNEKGKCVRPATKTQKVKKCKEDEEINPETGRCRKKCPEGKVRNEKGNCVNPKK